MQAAAIGNGEGVAQTAVFGPVKAAVESLYQCEATHRRTIPVREALDEQTVWEGKVEMFWLTGHPEATRCYAWGAKKAEPSDSW